MTAQNRFAGDVDALPGSGIGSFRAKNVMREKSECEGEVCTANLFEMHFFAVKTSNVHGSRLAAERHGILSASASPRNRLHCRVAA